MLFWIIIHRLKSDRYDPNKEDTFFKKLFNKLMKL